MTDHRDKKQTLPKIKLQNRNKKSMKASAGTSSSVKVPLPVVKKAILAQANIPLPALGVCVNKLNEMVKTKKRRAQQSQEVFEGAQKYEFEEALAENISHYKKLSKKSIEQLTAYGSEMSQILLYAKYLHEFEKAENQQEVIKYKSLYLESKEILRRELGDAEFAALMSDCMKASGKINHEHFGILFYADAYCEPEFQHIADVTNTVNLTAVAAMPKVPKTVKTSANLFGAEKEYELTPLKPGLGQVAVPKDPTKDNTVFVICPDLEKLSKDPKKMLESFLKAGGQSVFNQIQKAIEASNLPPEWKANIKVVGENAGAQIAEKCFEVLQKGLRGELLGEIESFRKTPVGQFVQKKAEKMVEQSGLQGGLQVTQELGGVSALVRHVASLDFQNVQTSPLLDPKFRSAHPTYDQFLTDARIPQSIGLAGLVLSQAKNLKLDEVLKGADQNLQQYHRYRVIKPALEFVGNKAMSVLGSVMSGAAMGSATPGIGTGIGALIGGGMGICKMIYEGYSLWKKKKQDSLKEVAAVQGVEIRSSFQPLAVRLPHAPVARFSPVPTHKPSPTKSTYSIGPQEAVKKSSKTKVVPLLKPQFQRGKK